MFAGRLAFLLCLTYSFVEAKTDYNVPLSDASTRKLPDICYPDIPKGRVPWIIYHRHTDYGWKEHTHRANIALAVNGYKASKTEMDMMELQLEVEIANALLGTKEMHDNDLALFIHSLIATNKNPRNFHGKDLVADLLVRVNKKMNTGGNVHPFLVLALCNSNAVELRHLDNIRHLTAHRRHETVEELELKSLALKAYACAADLKREFNNFENETRNAQTCVTTKQNKTIGHVGNPYTTALAVQAMVAGPLLVNPSTWRKDDAIAYLLKESVIEVNMIKAYYIELALNADSVRFIKDLYTGPPIGPVVPVTNYTHFIMYTVRAEVRPHIYHTISINVDKGWTLYDVMKRCAREGPAFEFSHYDNINGLPMIYSVSGIPNDAEENMFWRICLNKLVKDPATYEMETINHSPELLKLHKSDHVTLWYRSTDCS